MGGHFSYKYYYVSEHIMWLNNVNEHGLYFHTSIYFSLLIFKGPSDNIFEYLYIGFRIMPILLSDIFVFYDFL